MGEIENSEDIINQIKSLIVKDYEMYLNSAGLELLENEGNNLKFSLDGRINAHPIGNENVLASKLVSTASKVANANNFEINYTISQEIIDGKREIFIQILEL